MELDDTWAWVASGPEMQQVTVAGAPEAAEDAPVVDEDASTIPAPLQAGVRYTSYADFQIPYVRRTRRRNDDASTSTTYQDEQPDP
ncbi:hypothetical protein Tco_0765617 [Tanacetum coccineum]